MSQPTLQMDSTVMAINEFITSTVEFLNSFASTCESKLNRINNRMNSLETSLKLLEVKLNGVKQENYCNKGMEFLDKLHGIEEKKQQSDDNSKKSIDSVDSQSRRSVDTPVVLWKDHPVYSPFFRQIKLGVPIEAVKAKMRLNGYDPDVLDNDPLSPVPSSFLSN